MKRLLLVIIVFVSTGTMTSSNAQSPMEKWKKFEGDWKAEVTMWMDMSGQAMVDHLIVHNEMIMNGLFFTSRYSGKMMEMDYEGINTIGFNLEKKVFVTSWIDNMNSGIAYSEGKWNADGKSIEFGGLTYDVVSGKDLPTREIFTMTDDTHLKIEMFGVMNGMVMKTMEFNLTK